MSRKIQRAKDKALGLLKKGVEKVDEAKGVVVAGVATVGATVSQAAITFDKTTGQLTGSMDTANYYSGVEIGVGFLVVTMVTGAGIYAMKRFGK